MTIKKENEQPEAKLAKKIKENNDFLVITHIFPDGDAIGSLTAFHKLMTALGKDSRMICNSDLPYQYRFLPGFDEIKRKAEIKDLYKKKFVCM